MTSNSEERGINRTPSSLLQPKFFPDTGSQGREDSNHVQSCVLLPLPQVTSGLADVDTTHKFSTFRVRYGASVLKHRLFRFPLHPTSMRRTMFDCLSIGILMLDSVLVPYVLAWDVTPEGPWRVFTWIVAAFLDN